MANDRQQLILRPASAMTSQAMQYLITQWSGGSRYGLEAVSFRGSPPTMWIVNAVLLRQYGELPFTSCGRTIRWRWWHRWRVLVCYEVTFADLPEGG